MCPPERPRSGVSIPKIGLCITHCAGELNDKCALAGRRGRAHRHRPYPSPSYFSTQPHTNRITIYAQSIQTTSTVPYVIHPNEINRLRAICPNETTHPRVICPNETVGAVPMCPPERPRSGVSIPRIHALCAGDERWMRPCGATRAGTQVPPLPNFIIFFHAIPHKQNNHLRTICPNDINHPHAIRPYPSPPNYAVCHYPIGVILSIAQGWQVQRSLPWVTVQARRLPPWGLYSFHHIAFLCPPTHIGGGNASRTPAPIT